jgi:hypothetical protein
MDPLLSQTLRLTVPLDEFLRVLQEDYLREYLKSGGSAVKVVSGPPEVLERAREEVISRAETEGYLTAFLDPSEPDPLGKKPDLHRVDKLFFAATAEVDWRKAAADRARIHLKEHGVWVAEGRELCDLEGIAADNGREPVDLLSQYHREVEADRRRDRQMASEFRVALAALAQAQMTPDSVTPTTEEVMLGWLAGRTMPGAANALKKLGIFERINQSNARFMLRSFCHWLPTIGRGGLVLVLDFRPYEYRRLAKSQRQSATLARIREAFERGATGQEVALLLAEGEAEPQIYYSEKAYTQMLAQIRRFIDEIDWFERLLLVVLTTPSFYTRRAPDRNYNDYDALQTRIGHEVHDTRRANPAAALVHLEDSRES